MATPSYQITKKGDLLRTEEIGANFYPVTEDLSRVDTQWKSATLTTAGTNVIATPPKGNAMILTDLLVSGEKINGGIITVQFSDGTNDVVVNIQHVTDNGVNLAVPFAGRWRAWVDASIELVTNTNNQDATVSVGYYFIRGEGVLSFTDWDTLRG